MNFYYCIFQKYLNILLTIEDRDIPPLDVVESETHDLVAGRGGHLGGDVWEVVLGGELAHLDTRLICQESDVPQKVKLSPLLLWRWDPWELSETWRVLCSSCRLR